MKRKDVVIIGSKGSGFTYIAITLAKILSKAGFKLVARVQPQAGGSVGRKPLIPPFLGTGSEEYSIATTERTAGAEILIMIDPVGDPVLSIKNMSKGGIAIIDTSNPIAKYWLKDMEEVAIKNGVKLIAIDTKQVMKEFKDEPRIRNMFLMGVALKNAFPPIHSDYILQGLKEAIGAYGEQAFQTVKRGLEYQSVFSSPVEAL